MQLLENILDFILGAIDMFNAFKRKHPKWMEAIYALLTFLCIFAILWYCIDTLASSKGDYVGPTPMVIKK